MNKLRKLAVVALISLSFVAYLGKSYETTLRGIDSNIHAKVSLDFTQNGWIPSISPQSFNDHPFFFFWLNGLVMRILEPSAWSARVLTGGFAAGCVFLVFLLGKTLHSPLFGFLSALFYLFTRDTILTGATVSLDPPMLFFILLSFYFWQKQKWTRMGIATGIGLWIKTPVVLLVYPTAFLTAWIANRKQVFLKLFFSLMLALVIGSLVWIATAVLGGGWPLVQDYWIRQFWGTTIEGRNLSHSQDGFIFLRFLKNGFIPGLPFLGFGLFQIYRKKKWNEKAVMISLISVAILALVITALRFKMDYYLNPTFPFLSFLASYALLDRVKGHETGLYSAFTAFSLVFISTVVCAPISFGPEAFVALRNFIPVIQTDPLCESRVLLIAGGEPIGSSQDYRLVLQFYTRKSILEARCEQANEIITQQKPRWIVVSRQNLEDCLSAPNRELYPRSFRSGNQYLLSSFSEPEPDLGLFNQPLVPVSECGSSVSHR